VATRVGTRAKRVEFYALGILLALPEREALDHAAGSAQNRPTSALRPTAQEGKGVLDALLEDFVGKLWIGEGAGDLERPDH